MRHRGCHVGSRKVMTPNRRVQPTRSSASPPHSPRTRRPLGVTKSLPPDRRLPMRKVSFLVVCLLLGFASRAVVADEVNADNGHLLLSWCNAAAGKTEHPAERDAGRCLGYLHAVMAMNQVWSHEAKPTSLSFCPPVGSTTKEAVRIVVKYLDANPARLGLPSEMAAIEAFQSAWPCLSTPKP
jgi:hypothetical protein